MVEIEYTDEEIEQLDNYLQYEFNHDIYEELTNRDGQFVELFEPLEFFRVFYISIEQIEENKSKPLTVSRLLKKELCLKGEQKLSDEQKFFFYGKLLDYFSDDRHRIEEINICCREIEKLQANLDVYGDEPKNKPAKKQDAFEQVLEHLETLTTYKEKIAYLIQEKTNYEQQDRFEIAMWGEKNFAEKCKLEIEKLKQLKQLEGNGRQTINEIKRHKDITLDRATLFLNYLFTETKANCHNTKKAKAISFLTGYSENTIGDKLSALHSKADKNFVEYEKDMMIVKQYFESLGLTEIVKKIDRDLNISN